MTDQQADYWMKILDLQPNVEGGFYSQTYRSDDQCQLQRYNQQIRQCATAIYYLLKLPDSPKSVFHRIKADEMWHFYRGLPLIIHVLDEEEGSHAEFLLSNQVEVYNSARPQVLVRYGKWFGAEILRTAMADEKENYTLCGCTCAPGFDFQDFECATRSYLLAKFPNFEQLITRLTPSE